jgi:hypothetical protein
MGLWSRTIAATCGFMWGMWSIRWLMTRRLDALRISTISTGCQEPSRLASTRPSDLGYGRTLLAGSQKPEGRESSNRTRNSWASIMACRTAFSPSGPNSEAGL